MMPKDAHLRIKTVDVFFGGRLYGFKFFDHKHDLIFEIGFTKASDVETLVLDDLDVIVGVVAK